MLIPNEVDTRVITNEMPGFIRKLNDPSKRYHVFYGGRGGAKSWGIARWLIKEGTKRVIRALCTRELQNSMKESVYQLLVDQIKELGAQDYYTITETEIRGKNGTQINFSGLRSLKGDPGKLKSYEGIDVLWIEEAAKVLKSSFDTIDPTIRKRGAKIIISYNPELETDFIHQFFVVNDPPPDSDVMKVSHADNPWFPESLRKIMEHRKLTDYDGYLHIWEGHCKQTLEGAIYADELRAATLAGRITKVNYEPSLPVHTYWDLGYSDKTAIWFAQIVGFEYRIIDFYENRQKGPSHYIQYLQSKGYVYGTDYLPHDADYGQFAAEGRTVSDLMRAAGRKVYVVQRPKRKEITIGAVRTIFPNCYFDEKKTADGLQCLRHYRYDVDPDTQQFSKYPLHDENSHAADAFGTLALFLRRDTPEVTLDPNPVIDFSYNPGQDWMMR